MRKPNILFMPLLLSTFLCGCSTKTPTTSISSQEGNAESATVVSPQPTPTSRQATVQKLTVFLPGKDGKLHKTTVDEPRDLAEQKLWKTTSALMVLFRKAPEFIPAGTRLTDPIKKNKDSPFGAVFEARLNKEFLQSDLWRDKKKAQLAFEAITQTAAAGVLETISPTYPTRIYVLVEGKPIKYLGQLKVKNPVQDG